MFEKLWRWFYTLLFAAALPLIYARLFWRSRKQRGYRERWLERLGAVSIPEKFQQGIWVHAVSFGEVIVATPLIRALQTAYPDLPILMTTTTPTGATQISKNFAETVCHVYAPYDLPFCIERFLKRAKPRLTIFIETELWPNWLHALNQKNIPCLLANARLSEKSAKNYGKFSSLARGMMKRITSLAAQAKADADRFEQLGFSKDCLEIVGNIKFDIKAPDDFPEKTAILRGQLGKERLVFIAGSTHEGEEEKILAAFAQMKAVFPRLLLILVPRHPDRFEKVAALCRQKDLSVVLRSEKKICTPETDVFLGDTMGEMLLFYSVSDVAFVGGSLIERGGHNMLEPALFSLPIIVGPSYFNFSAVAALLLEANALFIVNGSTELAETLSMFFTNPTEQKGYGSRAKAVVEQNRGSIERHLKIIKKLLSASEVV